MRRTSVKAPARSGPEVHHESHEHLLVAFFHGSSGGFKPSAFLQAGAPTTAIEPASLGSQAIRSMGTANAHSAARPRGHGLIWRGTGGVGDLPMPSSSGRGHWEVASLHHITERHGA